MVVKAETQIRFRVNGKEVEVGEEPGVGLDMRLSTFLRDVLHLTGTKVSCGQGGCGACTVSVAFRDEESGVIRTRAVNSVSEGFVRDILTSTLSSSTRKAASLCVQWQWQCDVMQCSGSGTSGSYTDFKWGGFPYLNNCQLNTSNHRC